MSLIVEQAIYEIKLLADNVPDGKHIVTSDIRKLSARLYRPGDLLVKQGNSFINFEF